MTVVVCAALAFALGWALGAIVERRAIREERRPRLASSPDLARAMREGKR